MPSSRIARRPLNIIERAYQLARSGGFSKVEQIARRLTKEGFTSADDHLSGRSLRRELNGLIKEARLLLEQPVASSELEQA